MLLAVESFGGKVADNLSPTIGIESTLTGAFFSPSQLSRYFLSTLEGAFFWPIPRSGTGSLA